MEMLRCVSCIAAWHVCELAGQGSVATSYAHAIHAKVLVGRRQPADSPHEHLSKFEISIEKNKMQN